MADTIVEQARVFFDALVKSRFIEMFGSYRFNNSLRSVLKNVTDGTHKTPNYLENGVLFISAKNIRTGNIDLTDVKYISNEEYRSIQKRCNIEKGDVLLSKSGSLGSPVVNNLEVPFGIFESIAVLKPDYSKLTSVFLCEVLKSPQVQRQFSTITKGSSIKHLHLGMIEKVQICLPPLEEQVSYQKFVEQIDKSKDIFESEVARYDELIKSRFIEMFGTRETYSEKWTMKPFTSCCDVIYGFPFNSELFNENSEGMPLIRIRDINTGFSNTYTTEKVDPMYEIHNGDILVGMDGDFCAKKWTSGTALLNQRTCRMKGKADIINNQFMLYYLNPELQQIHRNTSSTTVKHLSAKEINKMKIPQPPLKLQEEFAAFVEQVDKSKVMLLESLKKIVPDY